MQGMMQRVHEKRVFCDELGMRMYWYINRDMRHSLELAFSIPHLDSLVLGFQLFICVYSRVLDALYSGYKDWRNVCKKVLQIWTRQKWVDMKRYHLNEWPKKLKAFLVLLE